MSPKQMNFLDNMTRAQAIRLMAKFNDDPYQLLNRAETPPMLLWRRMSW